MSKDIWRQIVSKAGESIDISFIRDEIAKVDLSKYRFVEMKLPKPQNDIEAETVYIDGVPVRFLRAWDCMKDLVIHRADIYAKPIH